MGEPTSSRSTRLTPAITNLEMMDKSKGSRSDMWSSTNRCPTLSTLREKPPAITDSNFSRTPSALA